MLLLKQTYRLGHPSFFYKSFEEIVFGSKYPKKISFDFGNSTGHMASPTVVPSA